MISRIASTRVCVLDCLRVAGAGFSAGGIPPPPPPVSSLASGTSAPCGDSGNAVGVSARLTPLDELRLSFERKQAIAPEALGTCLLSLATARQADRVLPDGPRNYLLSQVELAAGQAWEEMPLRAACCGIPSWQGEAQERLLTALTRVVLSKQNEALTEHGVSMCLKGLQSCKDTVAARAYLAALTPRISASAVNLKSNSLRDAMNGLRRFGDSAEMRALLAVLLPKIACCETLSNAQLGFFFQGIMRSGGKSAESLQVLQAFGTHLAAQNVVLQKPESLALVLNSLQNFDLCPEVRAVLASVTPKIEECQQEFSAIRVVMSFYGLQRLGGPEVLAVLAALVPKFAGCNELISPSGFSSIVFGLRRCLDGPEVRAVLEQVAVRLPKSREVFEPRSIGTLLNGLQKCGGSQESRGVLEAMIPKIIECPGINMQTLGFALYGLRSFKDCPEIRRVLAAFSPKISVMTETLTGHAISNVLYCMARFDSSPELLGFLQVLGKRASESTFVMSHQDIAMSLYGMNSCGDSAQSRMLLSVLAEKIGQCSDEPSEQSLSNSLYGLRRFSDSPELRALLAALHAFTKNKSVVFTEQGISNCFLGLGLAGGSAESHAMLTFLMPGIAAFPGALSWRSISRMLHSLRNFRDAQEVRGVIAASIPKIPSVDVGVGMTAVDVCSALAGLRFLDDCAETRAVLAILAPHLANRREPLDLRSVRYAFAGLSCAPSSDGAYQALLALGPCLQAEAGKMPPIVFEQALTVLRDRCAQQEARALLASIAPDVVRCFSAEANRAGGLRVRETLGAMVGDEAASLLRSLDAGLGGVASAAGDEAGLPAGWSVHEHDGRPYYHHEVHGSRWDKPPPEARVALPEGWAAHSTPEGQPYYYHAVHGSRWEVPQV